MSELSNYIDEYLKTEYTLKSTLKDSVQSSVYLYQKNDSAKQIVKISQKNRNDHVLRRLRGQLNKNTATIYEVCSNDEDVTVLEEYISGSTLGHIVEANGGTLKRELAVKYALDICNGLVFIHSLGIIHRDIKPSNIIITEQGEAVIIDFGIARLTDDSKYADTKNLGTAGYAAPEQLSREIEKRCVDVRTDVFGLGRTLYALLCGADLSRPPYAFASLKSRCPQVSDELEQIIMRATAREPEARFQTMEAFLQVLLALQEACTVDDTGKKAPFWQKVRRKKTADCEVLQSVLRTAKPMGRWMFALLAAVLMLQGATVAAKAAGVDRAAGKIPITLRDSSLRKLLIKENAALYTEKPVFLELNPNTLGCGDEVRVMLSLYSRNEKIGEYELVMGQKR